MTGTAHVRYESDTDDVTFTLPNGVFAVFPGEGIVNLAKEIKKTRKKAKKNVETKTLTQTLVPVKFKKMKEGKRYRITENSGTSVDITLDDYRGPEDLYNGEYSLTTGDYHFYSYNVESIFLIENSEIS